jgi:hypothetical protein
MGILFDKVDSLGSIFAGARGDIEAPSIANSRRKTRSNLGIKAASQVYKTITGFGLLPERVHNNKDHNYADLDASLNDDQTVGYKGFPLHELNTTSEFLATIHTWLAANSSFSIARRDLEWWWKIFHLRAGQIRDIRRITDCFYRSIQCGMRLLATEKGHLGWIHPQAQEGDRIVRIFGCDQYVVLRATKNRYRVVGDAILPGVEIGDQKYKGYKTDKLQII